jgi:monoamine oxidase
MYPKVGMTRDHLCDLAEPWGGIFFAGEATNTNACCTVQAAMETGVRAANQVRNYLATAT